MSHFLQTKKLIEAAIEAGCKTWADFENFRKAKRALEDIEVLKK
jgi:hypothetical protein